MSPAPTQLLAYFAGRTKRISFGTAVIVLPWHDPIRVAEEIALLDILCGGRCLFGFGRGAASVEYAGFRIPMGEARPRFAEAAQIIRKALAEPEFEWQGEFYQIPRTAIRPRPISHPEGRFYASAVSPESAEIMAKLGFGMLVVMQNEWPKAAENIVSYREIALSVGHNPPPPIILTNVSCAESRDEAHERAMQCLGKKWESIDNHYHFSDGHLATVKGYETYGKMAQDLCPPAEARRNASKRDRILRQDPDRRHARGLHPADRRIAAADRDGSSRHRILVRRHPAQRGRQEHAPVRRARCCRYCSATPPLRRRRAPEEREPAKAAAKDEFVRAGLSAGRLLAAIRRYARLTMHHGAGRSRPLRLGAGRPVDGPLPGGLEAQR